MRFNLSEDDFLKGKLVNPGYHHCKIVGFEEKMSKEKRDASGAVVPSSAYLELKFQVLDGPDKDVVLYGNFSEKAPGFVVPFIEALKGGAKMERKAQPIDLTKDKLVGQYIDVKVSRGSYNGKSTNQVDEFKPFTGTR